MAGDLANIVSNEPTKEIINNASKPFVTHNTAAAYRSPSKNKITAITATAGGKQSDDGPYGIIGNKPRGRAKKL